MVVPCHAVLRRFALRPRLASIDPLFRTFVLSPLITILLYIDRCKMSTHYNQLFTQTFQQLGYRVVYQPSCLINNYDQKCWPINFPDVQWTDNTLVVMHCQDFVSIRNGECPELIAIEKHFADRASQVVVVHWNIDLDKVYSGPMRLLHFPTHSYELLLNLNASK